MQRKKQINGRSLLELHKVVYGCNSQTVDTNFKLSKCKTSPIGEVFCINKKNLCFTQGFYFLRICSFGVAPVKFFTVTFLLFFSAVSCSIASAVFTLVELGAVPLLPVFLSVLLNAELPPPYLFWLDLVPLCFRCIFHHHILAPSAERFQYRHKFI